MYIYLGHLGHLYASTQNLSDDVLYCPQCGDSDCLIGYATTKAEAWALFKEENDWDYNIVEEFINSNWKE